MAKPSGCEAVREYLTPVERPQVLLLRILPANKMKVTLVEAAAIMNTQASLFDRQ